MTDILTGLVIGFIVGRAVGIIIEWLLKKYKWI